MAITVSECGRADIEGVPTMWLDYTVQDLSEGATLRILQYTIVADYNYTILFLDATEDGKWADAFAASAATIDLVFEGEPLSVDTSGLTYYVHETGFSLYMQDGLEALDRDDVVWALYDPYEAFPVITIIREDDTDLAGINQTVDTLTLDEYAALSAQVYDLDDYVLDDYGNLFNVFTKDVNGSAVLYYVTLKKGTDAFWTCNFACLAEDATEYMPQFMLWASTIELP